MGKVFRALKGIYKKIPITEERKTQWKGAFYRTFGFCMKENAQYRKWLAYQKWLEMAQRQAKQGAFAIDAGKLSNFQFQGTIAVHLHLFYVDLLEEFVQYFNRIPYSFDLLISIVDENEEAMIRKAVSDIRCVKQVIIKKVENRGRDVAPMLCAFGSELAGYDYFCHIHSKKSLFTGNEQMDWRRHLMEHLFGSEQLIRSVFYSFINGDRVGMVYPETFAAMPYWGHTWLQNAKSRDVLFERIGVSYVPEEKYIDFPMGTMFWARTDALRQFFDAKLQVEEFPSEQGQTDGTIAHAFERCTVPVCRFNGYNTLIYDNRTDVFTYNCGKKNFEQYYAKNLEQMYQEAEKYEILSFDIFDTLITRTVARPDDAFELLEWKLHSAGYKGIPYRQWRKEAEAACRCRHPETDCGLDDIYKEFQHISGLSKEQCGQIRQAEVDNELELIQPKAEMVRFFQDMVSKKKRVFLISDMYLQRADLEKLLKHCGIAGYEQLYISCECNLRKDNQTFWKKYSKRFDASRWMHVGDNEMSDMQISGDYGICGYHILSAADLYSCSSIGALYPLSRIDNAVTSVAQGLSLNCLFGSPFAWNEELFHVRIRREEMFGYAAMGPVIVGYMNHLGRMAVQDKVERVFFFAREGYLLQELFSIMQEYIPMLRSVAGSYMLVSRRALSVAAMREPEDMEELLDLFYRGSFREFLQKRFGITDKTASSEPIALPEEKEKARELLAPYTERILKQAEKERQGYLRYYKTLWTEGTAHSLLSDIGYSGTIQYYLSKLTQDVFRGYYFATDTKQRPLAIAGNQMHGYYIEQDPHQNYSKSYVHRYHLLLESILIAPAGQLVCMEPDGTVQYERRENPYYTEQIVKIQNGIRQYFHDFYRTCGPQALEADVDKELSEQWMKAAVEYEMVDQRLENCLTADDQYCSGAGISVLEYHRQNYYDGRPV